MLKFLSPEWIQALDEAARTHAGLAAATEQVSLTIEQAVMSESGAPVIWHVVLDHGRASVVAGPAESPTVRFSQNRETAAAIASGTDSAQRAFMTGRLTVGGDLRVLLEHVGALAQLDDVFSSVREQTDLSPNSA